MNQQIIPADLWQRCENIYHTHQGLCLQLQDEYGVNVNVLLLACILDQIPCHLPQQQWQKIIAVATNWDRELIMPFRNLRRRAKSRLTPFEYQKMLKLELQFERKVQQQLLPELQKLSQVIIERSNLNILIDEYQLDSKLLENLIELNTN